MGAASSRPCSAALPAPLPGPALAVDPAPALAERASTHDGFAAYVSIMLSLLPVTAFAFACWLAGSARHATCTSSGTHARGSSPSVIWYLNSARGAPASWAWRRASRSRRYEAAAVSSVPEPAPGPALFVRVRNAGLDAPRSTRSSRPSRRTGRKRCALKPDSDPLPGSVLPLLTGTAIGSVLDTRTSPVTTIRCTAWPASSTLTVSLTVGRSVVTAAPTPVPAADAELTGVTALGGTGGAAANASAGPGDGARE